MTGVDKDLATTFATVRKRALARSTTFVGPSRDWRGHYLISEEELARVEADLSRLREERDALRESGTRWAWNVRGKEARIVAAEARCARLQQALAGLESAVRILDVMLREPAAKGLMSAEDYRSYVQGAWLGVDEAAEKAREALAGQTSGSGSSAADLSVGERHGRQPDPGEIAGLLVELARWSRVAELNGDLHARIASALAGPDTLTAGEPGVAPDGTGRVAPADGCAERQSTADPSPAASAGPDTPTLPYVFDKNLKRWGLFLGDLPNADWIEYVRHLESLAGPDTPADSQEDKT